MTVRKTKSGHPNQVDAQRHYDKTGSPPEGVSYSPYKNPPFRFTNPPKGSQAEEDANAEDQTRVEQNGPATATATTGTASTNIDPPGTMGTGGAST